jgi:hypothetical protein
MKTESPEKDAAAQPGAAPGSPAASTDSPSAPQSTGGGTGGQEAAHSAFRNAVARLAEISEYISYYLATKTDSFKLAAREAFYFGTFVLVGLVAVVALIVVAAVLLLVGIANGIGGALGKVWLGDIIVAVAVLIILPIVARAMFIRLFGICRRQTVEKYESLKHEQQARFGHDVGERARESKTRE